MAIIEISIKVNIFDILNRYTFDQMFSKNLLHSKSFIVSYKVLLLVPTENKATFNMKQWTMEYSTYFPSYDPTNNEDLFKDQPCQGI